MIHFTIQGQTPSKKRGYTIVSKVGKSGKRKTWMIPNKPYRKWEKDAVEQLSFQKEMYNHKTIAEKVAVKCLVFRNTLRRIDMINAIQSVLDALEKSEIIDNDFLVRSMDGSRMFLGVPEGKERTEVYIEIFKGDYYG